MSVIGPELAKDFYRQMCLIKEFETRAYELFTNGLLPGSIHSYRGQEAVAVGVISNLNRQDYVLSTHRGHGHCLAKGSDPNKMMAELLGKRTGLCGGKGGSMHLFDFENGLLGCNGIVGSGMAMAVGAGVSIRNNRSDQVCVSFFGDGGANVGNFHESLNMASIWKLPVLFVCENNQYAMSTASQSVTAVDKISDRAASYSMPGRTVDGMDVEAVYEATREFVSRARQGQGPSLLECTTYRYRGHSRFDPDSGPYRTKKEWEEWISKDPLEAMVSKGLVSSETAKEIDATIKQEIEAAVQFALDSPLPEPESAMEDIYFSDIPGSKNHSIGGS